jgi:hypothetical protein
MLFLSLLFAFILLIIPGVYFFNLYWTGKKIENSYKEPSKDKDGPTYFIPKRRDRV